MDNRQLYITIITKRLNYLKAEVQSFNSLNLTDINVHAENFYRDLFNCLGYSFDNTNFYEQNYPYIDLIDKTNKLAIQVTAQNDNAKIKKSIEGFFKKNENKGYKLKLFLIAKEAKNYRTNFGDNFNHKEDVLDINRLLKFIENKERDELEAIANFLDKEILQERKQTESSEVETIMALIDHLSNNKNRKLTNINGEVDPQKKIEQRFSEHADFIKSQYQVLFGKYNNALAEARAKIDSVDAAIISDYLKDESDLCLTKENNNPKLALASLVDIFYSKLSSNGIKFDKQAIKFYLLDELLICNVFPNK